jgi:hypothetical protein
VETQSEVALLVNISAEKWPPRHHTYLGSLEVRSSEPGQSYAITPIRGCTGVMDLGDKRTHEYRITAREIAEDIARELNSDSGEGSFHGVFVAAGQAPTETELADAHRRLEEFQRRLVAAADLEWERTKNPMFITDLERRAARHYDFTIDCKACQAKLSAAQGDLADERKKTAGLTHERDDALRIARGGSTWRRIGRAAKWFLIGAAAGAVAAKNHSLTSRRELTGSPYLKVASTYLYKSAFKIALPAGAPPPAPAGRNKTKPHLAA